MNYLTSTAGDAGVRSAYGANYDRLAELKSKYDPKELFQLESQYPTHGKLPVIRNIAMCSAAASFFWPATFCALLSSRLTDRRSACGIRPGRLTKMKTLTWKTIFAALNPSPLFEAIAALAEELATRDRQICPRPSTRREEASCHSTRL